MAGRKRNPDSNVYYSDISSLEGCLEVLSKRIEDLETRVSNMVIALVATSTLLGILTYFVFWELVVR